MPRRSTNVARRLSKAIKNDVFTVDGQIASAGVSANQYDSLAALPLTGIAAGTKAFVEDSDRLYISNGTGWYSIALTNASPSITSVLDSDGGITPFTLATDGSATVITVAATDSDGTPLTYNYSVSSGSLNGSTVSQDSSVFTVTPHDSNDTTFDLTFTASDGINTATSGANSFTLQFTDYTLKNNSAIYYDFSTNITSGTTVTNDGQINDTNGYSSNGTLVGTTPPAYSTDLGGSLRFTKTSGQYLALGNYNLNNKTNFSMVGCIAPLSTTTYSVLASNYQGTGFFLTSDGRVSGRMDNGDYDGSLVRYKGTSGFTTTVSNDGTPRVVGMTMTTNTLTSYLNGEACSSPLSIAGSIICNSGLSLGSVYLGSINSGLIVDGYILYFAFYPSTALTTTQHNDMYLSLKSSFGF